MQTIDLFRNLPLEAYTKVTELLLQFSITRMLRNLELKIVAEHFCLGLKDKHSAKGQLFLGLLCWQKLHHPLPEAPQLYLILQSRSYMHKLFRHKACYMYCVFVSLLSGVPSKKSHSQPDVQHSI